MTCHFRDPRPSDVSQGVDVASSCTVQTSLDWPSGVYIVRVATGEGVHPPTGFFVVRPQRRTADILLVLATNTYNAYNHFGGANTYVTIDAGHSGPATRVSFNRPLMPGFLEIPDELPRAAGVEASPVNLDYAMPLLERGMSYASTLAGWAVRERVFAHWAFERGFRLDFAVSEDLERAEILDGYRLVLSVGHDEYWSWGMRDTMESHIARGGNVAFFSANTCYFQVRYAANGDAMDTFKGDWRQDPVLGTTDERRLSGIWAHPKIGRPEAGFTGLSYAYGGMARMPGATPAGSGGYAVYRPAHWCFEGTELTFGDVFGTQGMIVGYECDGCRFGMVDGLPVPTGEAGTPETLEILALSPVSLWSKDTIPEMLRSHVRGEAELYDLEVAVDQIEGNLRPDTLDRYRHGHAVLASYTANGTVFHAGTTDWTYGLRAGDAVVERITTNVLKRLSGG